MTDTTPTPGRVWRRMTAEQRHRAARVLMLYHLAEQRPMMGAFLDALGIAHDAGLIRDDDVTPDEAKVAAAAAALANAYPAADVSIYLNTLLCQDPKTWGALAGLGQLQA